MINGVILQHVDGLYLQRRAILIGTNYLALGQFRHDASMSYATAVTFSLVALLSAWSAGACTIRLTKVLGLLLAR